MPRWVNLTIDKQASNLIKDSRNLINTDSRNRVTYSNLIAGMVEYMLDQEGGIEEVRQRALAYQNDSRNA